MNIVQFSPSIGEKSGREYMMKRIAESLDAPVYTLSKDIQEDENKKLVKSYNEFQESVNLAREMNPKCDELDNADLIIAHSSLSSFILSDIDTPVMLMNHGYFKEFTTLFDKITGIIDDTHEFLVRQDIQRLRSEMKNILSQADILVANSEYVQKQIKDLFELDSTVIYDPIDWEFYHPTNNDGDYYLWVGRHYWLKRPEVALEAFQELDEQLHVTSSVGPYSNEIGAYIRSRNNVTYHGYVPKEKLRELYSGANALIHTSYDEDCPTVIREAMACNTPSIAVDIGANREVMQGTGVLFDNDNEIIDNLYNTVQNFNGQKNQLRQKAEKYSTQNFEKQLKSAIQASDF